LGTIKKNACYFDWKVRSTIGGIEVNVKCSQISFEGKQNKSNIAGAVFAMKH
jgi:hypothetical protein